MIVKVNENMYSKDIVLKACFTFIDKYYFAIDKQNEYFIISIESKEAKEDGKISGQFWNELLEQECKAIVSTENKNVRELILTRALYSAYIDDTEDECAFEQHEYNLDDIAKDWFENE